MIDAQWGFLHPPFSLDSDARFLFESAGYREGLARLLFAARELRGGITLLTGDIGCGKTTLAHALLRTLPAERYRARLLVHPALPVGQLLASILRLFGGKRARGGKAEQVAALHTLLLGLHERGLAPVLAVDEAQLLERPQLEELRLLTNLETHEEKVVHLILIGQPELARRTARFPELAQRIVMRGHLRPFSLEETRDYVSHRLRIAGASQAVFTEAGVAALYRATGGVPRLINILAAHALFLAAASRRPQVDAAAVTAAAQTLEVAPATGRPAQDPAPEPVVPAT